MFSVCIIFFLYNCTFFLQEYIDTCKTQIDKVKYNDEDVDLFVHGKSNKKSDLKRSKKRKVKKRDKKQKKKKKCSSSSTVNIKDSLIIFG